MPTHQLYDYDYLNCTASSNGSKKPKCWEQSREQFRLSLHEHEHEHMAPAFVEPERDPSRKKRSVIHRIASGAPKELFLD